MAILRRTIAALAVISAFCGATVGVAGATTLHTSPTGSGLACTSETPCALDVALESGVAEPHDEVLIGSGTYHLGSTVIDRTGLPLWIHGDPSQPAPVIASSSPTALAVVDPGSTVQHLRIVDDGPAFGVAFNFQGAYADHVVATSSAQLGTACVLPRGVLANSICVATGDEGVALETLTGNGAAALAYEDTLVGQGNGGFGLVADLVTFDPLAVTLVNTIARGARTDVKLNSPTTTVTARFSNFASIEGPVLDAGGNQSAAPVFVDPLQLDFHEAPCSPTVGTGIVDAGAAGFTDIDGEPRGVAGTTDIGADELSGTTPPNCGGGTGGGGGGGSAGDSGAGGGGVTVTLAARPAPKPSKLPPLSLSKASLTVSAFAATRRAGTSGPHVRSGSVLRFVLSSPARVTATVQVRTTTACKHSRKRCTRWVTVGTAFVMHARAGVTRRVLAGKVGRRMLQPGVYRLALVAADATGRRTPPATLPFRIVRDK